MLLGCRFSPSPGIAESDPESVLLERSRRQANAALGSSENLLDVVQALALLAAYFYFQNRPTEGYYHSFTASRLALDLKLHQITAASIGQVTPFNSQCSSSPGGRASSLSPTNDVEELRRRAGIFWQVYLVDRCWSAVYCLSPAFGDGDTLDPQNKVLTPWPCTNDNVRASWNVCRVSLVDFLCSRYYRRSSRTNAW